MRRDILVLFQTIMDKTYEEPILLENTYIPYYLCTGIEQYNFSTASLYHTLTERYSLNLYHTNETIEAISVEKGIKKPGTPKWDAG